MQLFVKTESFQNLNIGLSLDEGVAFPTEDFVLYYGEKCMWGKLNICLKLHLFVNIKCLAIIVHNTIVYNICTNTTT